MKRRIFTISGIFALLILVSSCEELLNGLGEVTFEGEEETFEFTIEPIDETGEYLIFDSIIENKVDSLLAENDVDKESLTSVKCLKAELSVVTAEGDTIAKDFSSFASVSVLVGLEGDEDDELLEIASLDDGDFSSLLSLDVFDIELIKYVKADKLKIKIIGVLDDGIEVEIDAKLTVKFQYTGDLLS